MEGGSVLWTSFVASVFFFVSVFYKKGYSYSGQFDENREPNFRRHLIFVVPCIMLYNGEISLTRCNNCVFYSQWLYATCFG